MLHVCVLPEALCSSHVSHSRQKPWGKGLPLHSLRRQGLWLPRSRLKGAKKTQRAVRSPVKSRLIAKRRQPQQLLLQLRWGPEKRGRALGWPGTALIDTHPFKNSLGLVDREASRRCIPKQMWPGNQGVSFSLRLYFVHRPNQIWKSRQKLPLGKAPQPPLHLPWSPLCE